MSRLLKAQREYHFLRVLLIGCTDKEKRQELRKQLHGIERGLDELRSEGEAVVRMHRHTQQEQAGAPGG